MTFKPRVMFKKLQFVSNCSQLGCDVSIMRQSRKNFEKLRKLLQHLNHQFYVFIKEKITFI